MHKLTHELESCMSTLIDDARALLNATADLAGDKVNEARQRLEVALDDGREMVDRVREKVGERAEAAGEAVHNHPYQAIAIGFGLGAILGYLVTRRGS